MRSILVAASACMIVAALLSAPATAAGPDDERRPPTELWERFPLDPARDPVDSPPPAKVEPAPTPPPRVAPIVPPSSPGTSPTLILALLAGCAALTAAGGLAVVGVRRKRRHWAELSPADCDMVLVQLASWRGGHVRTPEEVMVEQSGTSGPVGTTERVDIGAR